ncbi:unnamed protein product [Phytophthora fragariaefolia]|uniref:Unnamed protein product n=1 Tax=Phytophthora fragariaefolia TaxID=1490495 RepID=A0A9W6XKG2_9STRA|nr:unnamed protein product [Phytophthora fragariaefolia]
MQRDIDDGRTPSSDDGSHSPAPHTSRGPDEPEDEHGVEAEHRSPSDAEVRDTFSLSPPTSPPSNVSSNLWDSQGGMTSIEAAPRFLPSLNGDTGLGFQHLTMPTPERSVDTSSVLQTPALLSSLGAPYNTIGAARGSECRSALVR